MATEQKSAVNESNDIPSWIEISLFEPILKNIVTDFHQIKKFNVKRALSAGENFASIMWRLEADIKLKDDSSQIVTLMLKTSHESGIFVEIMKYHNVFAVEAEMYHDIVPEFEQIYKNIGVEVKFGAQSYEINTIKPYILLEDLTCKGFVNINRLEGLDINHTQLVLKKLAQWHAVSAVRVENKGLYSKNICESYFKDDMRVLLKSSLGDSTKIQMDCIKQFNENELYYERICEKNHTRLDELFAAAQLDPNEFNVLNHGDCWSNNIMFKHDSFGNVEECYLVDYQVPHYDTPAQDLYYFLLSSTKYEIKINRFDYFIRYYHTELLKYLKLLKYSKEMPTLKDLHIMLHKYNIWGLDTVMGVMSTVLLDPKYGSNLDNFIGESERAKRLKIQAYTNPRYRKHCEMILPWLYYRGAI